MGENITTVPKLKIHRENNVKSKQIVDICGSETKSQISSVRFPNESEWSKSRDDWKTGTGPPWMKKKKKIESTQ